MAAFKAATDLGVPAAIASSTVSGGRLAGALAKESARLREALAADALAAAATPGDRSGSMELRETVASVADSLERICLEARALEAQVQAPGGEDGTNAEPQAISTVQSKKTYTGHKEGVCAIAVVDACRVVTASDDKTLRIWVVSGETSSSNCCSSVLEGHTDVVNAVAAVGPDRIISGSRDKSVKSWNVDTCECLLTFKGHSRGVCAVVTLNTSIDAAAPCTAASASQDKTVKIWDLSNGACKHTLSGHRNIVHCLVTMGGGFMATGSEDKTLRVWNLSDTKESDQSQCIATLEGHRAGVSGLAVLHAAASIDGATEQPPHAPLPRIVSASKDRTLKIWVATSIVGDWQCSQTLEGHTAYVRHVLVLDAGRIVSASSDRTLRIWDRHSDDLFHCVASLEGHSDTVLCAATLDHFTILSGSDDSTMRSWTLPTDDIRLK